MLPVVLAGDDVLLEGLAESFNMENPLLEAESISNEGSCSACSVALA
jgi:hypothetical protein